MSVNPTQPGIEPLANQTAPAAGDRLYPARVWLYVLAAFVLAMVVVGGATRLTDSGLSITSWKPISGIIPPLTIADWQAELEAYRQIPEYQLINKGMSLAEFQGIFWWEWAHRFLGRFVGLVFFVPFVVFLAQRRLPRSLIAPLVTLFVLGGAQGALGWWMVTSGLTERVDVSQYRLAAHLGAAALLFVAIIWVARRIRPRAVKFVGEGRGWRLGLVVVGVLAFIQLLLGALVAGLDAGLAYNTWPLMGDRFTPDGMWQLVPAWLNVTENPGTVQFFHRMGAYVLMAAIGLQAFVSWQKTRWQGTHHWAPVLLALVLFQAGLGIATLLYAVPISLALFHQATAFILLAVITAYIADFSN
jgi:heme a synthase